jgi:hypothetical protein
VALAVRLRKEDQAFLLSLELAPPPTPFSAYTAVNGYLPFLDLLKNSPVREVIFFAHLSILLEGGTLLQGLTRNFVEPNWVTPHQTLN